MNYLHRTGILILALIVSGSAMAHGDKDKPLFVAPGGVDAGRCQDAAAPCKSIAYALQRVGKGGQIRVAAGNYEVDSAESLFPLVSGDIDVRGGYRQIDRFAAPDSAASILTGVPPEYTEALARRGFHVLVDSKGIHRDLAVQTDRLLAIHEALKSSMPATRCVGGSINGMACNDVDLLSHVGPSDISANPGNGADVWGFVDLNSNREYAIVGFDNGTAVFDVTDAQNPKEVGFIDGQRTTWRDIKVYQFWNSSDSRWNAHAYVTTDGSTDGLFVIDLSELPHRVQRVNYPSEFFAAHNIYATNTDFGTGLSLNGDVPTLVIAGSNIGDGPYRAYSVSNPAAPSFEIMPGSGRSDYMHDAASMIITDSRKDTQCVNGTTYCEILFDFNEMTIDIWDITDTKNPSRLSRTRYPNAVYVHSGWWSEDKQYLYVHDELDEQDLGFNTTLRVYSLANLLAPTAAGTWTGPTPAIDHNGFVRGNRYYMSNYSRGLTILDISNPADPVEVGHLDTYPASDGNSFVGAWGTYPFFHSGNVAISDIGSGLYMARDQTLDVPQGSLALSATSFGGTEGDQLQIAVGRSGGVTGAVGVGFEIVPATGGADDIAVVTGTLAWADADDADKTISLDLLVDGTEEPLERMLVKLVAPTGGATLAPTNVASVYVSDTGAAPGVEFDRDVINTTERGFATAVAVIRRIGSAVGAVSVDYSLTAGNADAGVDYQGATNGTIEWADGDADPRWIEFPMVDDGTGEPDEFFELTLSNASGAVVGTRATLRVNIADGTGVNSAPNAIAGANQRVGSGSTVTLDGRQSNDPDGDALAYEWTQVAGAAVALSGADSAVATFAAPTVSSDTLLRFELRVTDSTGLSNTSATSVTVRKPGGDGSGGGATGWAMLLLLVGALLFERVLLDNRLLAIRTR